MEGRGVSAGREKEGRARGSDGVDRVSEPLEVFTLWPGARGKRLGSGDTEQKLW